MLGVNSQKVDGERIAAFVRYRNNAKEQVGIWIGPRADRALGGGIDALVVRDEEIRHGRAFEPGSGGCGGNLVASAIAGGASIVIEPRVASGSALPVSTRVSAGRHGGIPFERNFDGYGSPTRSHAREQHRDTKRQSRSFQRVSQNVPSISFSDEISVRNKNASIPRRRPQGPGRVIGTRQFKKTPDSWRMILPAPPRRANYHGLNRVYFIRRTMRCCS
jgi:hypothetical protein